MEIRSLRGRYARLQAELSKAYAEQPWPSGRIDRLAEEIAATERAISALGAQPGDAAGPTAGAVHEVGARPHQRSALVAMTRLTPFGRPVAAVVEASCRIVPSQA